MNTSWNCRNTMNTFSSNSFNNLLSKFSHRENMMNQKPMNTPVAITERVALNLPAGVHHLVWLRVDGGPKFSPDTGFTLPRQEPVSVEVPRQE